MCNFYQIQDYLEIGLPIAKLDFIPKKDDVFKLYSDVKPNSILYSNKLCDFPFKNKKTETLSVTDLKSDFSGIYSVSNCVSVKDPDMLCLVTLSSIDQFKMYVYDKYNTFKQIKPFASNLKNTHLHMFSVAQDETCLTNKQMFKQARPFVTNEWNQNESWKPVTKTLKFILLNTSYIYNQIRKSVFFGCKKKTHFFFLLLH